MSKFLGPLYRQHPRAVFLDREIQQLQAQREAKLSRRDPLTLNRDLALKSLNTLKNKTAELQLASTAPTSEVRFAAPAVLPLRAEEGQSLVVATALGTLVGAAGRRLCRLCRRLHGEGAAVAESGVAWVGALRQIQRCPPAARAGATDA